MKKKVFFISVAVIALAITAIIAYQSSSYSMIDIDADNYEDKIKLDKKSILGCGIDGCIPGGINLTNSKIYAPSNNFEGNGIKIRKEKKNNLTLVTILDSKNEKMYFVWFDEKRAPRQCHIWSNPVANDIRLKDVYDKLFQKGYTLKKSKYIDGNDILIKETENSFIIVDISNKYDLPKPPTALNIYSYSKKRNLFL